MGSLVDLYRQSLANRPRPEQPSPSVSSLKTPAQLAQRGAELMPRYQAKTPWASNAAYDNVNLAPTQYGANQSTPQVRDRVANRMDPTSWAIQSRTPAEINQQIGDRTDSHLASLREKYFDPNNSRGGYQYSPANTGIVGLRAQEQQAAQQELAQRVANYRQWGLARDEHIVNDPTAQARYGALNPGHAGPLDPGQYRAQLGNATVAYNHYSRSAREAGQNPQSFDAFLSQYGANQLSPEVQQHIQNGRDLRQQSLGAQDQRRNSRGPSLQFAQYMNQRYGLPMALPSDPQQAQQWQNSLAMQGNPYAAQSNLYNQQNMATMAQTNANNMAQLQRTMAEQAGFNYRAGLQQQPQLTPDQRAQVIGQWTQHDPTAKRDQAYKQHIAAAQADGRWDANGGADRNKIMSEATARGDDAARIANDTRRMLSHDPVFGSVVGSYGLPVPTATPTPQAQPAQAASQPSTAQPSTANPAGIDPGKNIPDTPAPTAATNDDMFLAYSSLKKFNNGAEPTFSQIQKYLEERGKAIPQPAENSGDVRPYYNYSHNLAEGQRQSPYHAPYMAWLEANKQQLGAEPPSDPHWQYAPGNFSGF